MSHVEVVRGVPEDRPAGFPCFGCGEQVTEERGVPVAWPDGRTTAELICGACAPRYSPSMEDEADDPACTCDDPYGSCSAHDPVRVVEMVRDVSPYQSDEKAAL